MSATQTAPAKFGSGMRTRGDHVIAAPLLERPQAVERYAPGSWGPDSVSQLIAPRRWHLAEDGQ
jgi:hypothetical protein